MSMFGITFHLKNLLQKRFDWFLFSCSVFIGCYAQKKPWNVLMVVSDDLNTDLGSYGGPAITPSLDKFAASPGTMQFDRAYVQQAICCPSRSSFLLGRRPDTTRVWDLKTHSETLLGRKSG